MKRQRYLAGGLSDLGTYLNIPVDVNDNDNINDCCGGGDNGGMDMRKLRGGYREKWIGFDPTASPVLGRQLGGCASSRGCITVGRRRVVDGPIRGHSVRDRGFINPPLRMVIWDIFGNLTASEEPVPLRPVFHLTISIRLPIYTNDHPHPYCVMH